MNGRERYENKILEKVNNMIANNQDKPYLKGFRYFLNDLAPSSIYDYVSRVNSFMNYTKKNPKDLVLDDYTIYLGELTNKTSSYQIVTYAALKKFSVYLKGNKVNMEDPMQYVSRPKFKESIKTIEKRKVGYLNKDEIQVLKDAVDNGIGTSKAISFQEDYRERDMAIVLIFLNTGIRSSALCNLDIDNIHEETKSIVVMDKGSKVKEYRLADKTWEFLTEWITKRGTLVNNDENALFISNRKTRISYYAVRHLVKKYSQNITGKNITPHKLRATYGTQLYNMTRDIEFVRKCMGHSNPAITALYVRGNNDITEKANNIISDLI